MANRTTKFCHSNGVCESEENEDERGEYSASVGVVDTHSFLLDCRDVRQTRKEEGIDVFGMSRARNDTPRKDIANFVAMSRPQIQDNPDIYPTVGFLIAIELCAVDREHNNHVVVLYIAIFDGTQIVLTAEDIVEDVLFRVPVIFLLYPSLLSPVGHRLGHLGALPTSLELWAKSERSELFPGNLLHSPGLLECILVVTGLQTTRGKDTRPSFCTAR